jgi:2-hydroxychromene-2-carboxylate isomerase
VETETLKTGITMSKTVEFFFDYVSPATYFAHFLLPRIADKTGAKIIYRPFLLGGIFKTSGNNSPMSVPAKGAWLIKDLERFAKRYKLPFALNPNFPIKTIQIMRGACWLQEKGDIKAYSDAMFKAVWEDKRNLNDEQELNSLLEGLSIDPVEFHDAVNRQEIKDKLRANTDEAIQRGAFGAPTFFVGDEMFWGQDRLDFVEEALSQ